MFFFFFFFFFVVVCLSPISLSSSRIFGHDIRTSRHVWPATGLVGAVRRGWSGLVGGLGCDDGMDGTDGM